MKRAIIVFSLFAIFSGLFAVENLFSFSIGPQSGLVFYGDEDIKEDVKTLHGSHALVGAQAEVNVNPFKQITFFAGAHILCDFVKENKNYSNHIHYDFPFGVKIYPGLGGLCGGMAYTFGMRYDNVQMPETSPYTGNSSWGNGFKFLLEYNFAHDFKSHILPTIGVSWKHIPRGNKTSDNMISAYVLLNL